MPARRAPLLFALAAVALAGCGGPAASGTPTVPATPAPVPTAPATPTATPDPDRPLAPGVTAAGVEQPGALLAAHYAVLSDASYVRTANRTTRYTSGSLRGRVSVTTRVQAPEPSPVGAGTNGSRLIASVWTAAGPAGRIDGYPGAARVERYATPEGTYVALFDQPDGAGGNATAAAGVAYRHHDTPARVEPVGVVRRLPTLLAAVDTRVVAAETAGDRSVYRLAGAEIVDVGALVAATDPPPGAGVRDPELALVVDDRGLVRRARVAYAVERAGVDYRVTWRVTYGPGDVTVEPPAWYPTARNRTSGPAARARGA